MTTKIILTGNNFKEYKSLYPFFILFFLLMAFGCSAKLHYPAQVTGSVIFGHYKFSPPIGYWYFPKKFPEKISKPEDLFLITFWEDKNTAENIMLQTPATVFYNFAVSPSEYRDFRTYYEEAKAHGVTYEPLPMEASTLENLTGWSCKYLFRSFHSIECITLKDNLITIGGYGANKDEVLTKALEIKKIIESFTLLNIGR